MHTSSIYATDAEATSSYTLVGMNNTPDSMSLFGDDAAEPKRDSAADPAIPSEDAVDARIGSDDASDVPDSTEDVADSRPWPSASGDLADRFSVAASAATRRVASEDEMDAWLSQGTKTPAATWMATDDEADAAMAAWIAADPGAGPVQDGPVIVTAGRLDRVRPKRRPLVPVWLVWVLLAVLLIGVALAGGAAYLTLRARVFVPTVAGLQTQAARDRLATVGLTLTVSDRRFSTLPVDTILAQTPEAGAKAKRGSAVTVVVSAGTEEFTMPDVVGEGLSLARSQLEQKGLQVQVETQASDQPSDTVLATNPAAGSPMHTGDIVRLTVAAGTTVSTPTSGTLVPFKLTGVRVIIDPASAIAGQPDTTLEVARRLQSLLEASGATVSTTRSAADSGTSVSLTSRQQRAREGSSTVSIGFDVVASGTPGVALAYPSSSVASITAQPSQTLASQISSAMAGQAINARQAAGASDVVLSVTQAPYNRVTLGSTASPEDLARFRDPSWADKIARAVYQGIASIYGIRNTGGL